MEDSGYLPPSMENSGFVHLLHPGLPGAKLLQDVDASGFLLKEHRLHQSFHLPADVGTRTRPLRLVRRNRKTAVVHGPQRRRGGLEDVSAGRGGGPGRLRFVGRERLLSR